MDLAIVLFAGQRALSAILSAIPEKVRIALDICRVLKDAALPITSENVLLNAGDQKASLGSRRTVRRCLGILAERGILTEAPGKLGKFKVWELQNVDEPLTLDIAKVLRDADAEFAKWLLLEKDNAVHEQGVHDLTVADGLSMILTAKLPATANLSPDSSRITDAITRESTA